MAHEFYLKLLPTGNEAVVFRDGVTKFQTIQVLAVVHSIINLYESDLNGNLSPLVVHQTVDNLVYIVYYT